MRRTQDLKKRREKGAHDFCFFSAPACRALPLIPTRTYRCRFLFISFPTRHKKNADALLQLKWIVEQHDAPLTREILELVQREADLITRGVKRRNMEGLRRRLLNLFLQFVEDPRYNPEAKRLLRVHQDVDYFQKNVIRNPGSQSYHDASEYEISPELAGGAMVKAGKVGVRVPWARMRGENF